MAYKKLNKKKFLAGGVGVTLALSLFLSSSIGANPEDDKIHFINTGNTDAILLESNNRFALIDAGTTENQNISSYNEILNYIKKLKGDNSKFYLEIVVATHPSKKALGELDEIINNDEIIINNIVLEEYETSDKRLRDLEKKENVDAYYNLVNTISEKNINRITEPTTDDMIFGDFKINFINTLKEKLNMEHAKEGNSSLGVIVSKDKYRALLSGGINNLYSDEDRLASKIGSIDLLKVANQGDKFSSTENFIKLLKPKISILTGDNNLLHPNTYKNIKNNNGKIYSTSDNDDIVATFTSDGIKLDKNVEVKNGWYKEFDKLFYYDKDGNLYTGWHNIDGKDYFFYDDGTVHTGWLNKDDGSKMYMHEDGSIAKGLLQIDDNGEIKTYYFDENGNMKTGWVDFEGRKYYFNENPEDINYGRAFLGLIDIWVDDAMRTFKFDENGAMQTGLIQVGDVYYYFNDIPDRGYVGEALKGVHVLNVNGVENIYTFGDDGVLLNVE